MSAQKSSQKSTEKSRSAQKSAQKSAQTRGSLKKVLKSGGSSKEWVTEKILDCTVEFADFADSADQASTNCGASSQPDFIWIFFLRACFNVSR